MKGTVARQIVRQRDGQYAILDDEEKDGAADDAALAADSAIQDLLAPPTGVEVRLRALEHAIAGRTAALRVAAQQRAEEARRAARQKMIDGDWALEAYRTAISQIEAALAAQLSDVPAPPQRGELRERVAAVVAESAAGWYKQEVERLEHVFATWRPALAGEIVEAHHE